MTPAVSDVGDTVAGLLEEAERLYQGDPQRCVALATQAEELAERHEDETGLLASLILQGRGWFRQAEWEQARTSFLTALAWTRHRRDRLQEGECLYLLGLTALRQREIPTALEWFFRAQEAQEGSANPATQARIHSGIGAAYGTAGRYREASEELSEALRLAREGGEPLPILMALGNVAMLLESSGNLRLALSRYKETLELAHAYPHPIYVAQTHAALCRVLARLGQLFEATDHGQQAVSLADDLNHPQQRIGARRALGEALEEAGRLDEAERWLMEALEMAEGEPMRADWAELLHRLGRLNGRLGDAGLARQYHEAALTQAVEDGAVADQAREHRALAELCERAGDLPATVRHLKAQIQAEELVQRQAAEGQFLAAMARLEWEKAALEPS